MEPVWDDAYLVSMLEWPVDPKFSFLDILLVRCAPVHYRADTQNRSHHYNLKIKDEGLSN